MPKEVLKELEDIQNLRTCVFARLRWKLDKIQFVVSNKREAHFGGNFELLPRAEAVE
jgi:hypothetical protein